MAEEQRIDFTDLLSQVDFLDELLEADNEQQLQTQVPAAGYAGDVDKDLRDILGDEFMDSFGPHARDMRDAPQAELGTPAEESDAMSSGGFASSFDSDEIPLLRDEGMKKSAISSGTSCSMLVDRLNKNNAGMNDARAGAQVCASMVGTVDLHFTDQSRAKEWKDRVGSVPEGWEEMCRKKGFVKCCTRLTLALEKLQGSELEVEMLSISNVLSKIYRMSSSFVGAGMLFQATQAFVYEEEEAKGNVARTILLVRALNTISIDSIKAFWKEVCLSGTIPVKFAPRSGVSSDGPVIEMMGAEGSCEFAWTMFLTGWIKFLSKGQETDIDVAKWKQKYWATREKHHVLWQAVNSDGSLEDVELWFPREDGANADMVRGETLINGREKLAATLFERCRQAMICMHPRFMEKYAVVVAQKALNDEEFEQKDGVPVVKDFEEMRKLLRKTQKVWKADPVAKGKVPKSSGGGGGGGNGGSGGGKKKSEACRICKSKSHKTKDCDKRAGTSCRQWQEKGVCSFGDECVHEHKESEKGQTNKSSGTGAQRVPGKPAWIKPTGAPDGWKPPGPNATSMAMTNEDVPWTPGKVHENKCRGEECKKVFKEKEDDWLGRKLPNGEQLSMPVWCPECREKRRAMHSMCIELEHDECDQDDREDDVPTERCGVLLEEVDMVVMVITTEEEIEGLEDFLAGLETAQRVIRDQEIAIEPIVPMDHRMGGDRTIEQVQAAEMFSTFVWEQEHVDDSTGGANAKEIEAMKELSVSLPVELKAAAGAWWQRFLEEVPVEETTVMLRDLGIGANAVCKDKKEQGADAECEDGVGACPSVLCGSPPQYEERSAAAACTSRAAAGTVTAALMQARAVVEGKVAMYKDTPSEVSNTVRKKVTEEVMWMVHRQLHLWHSEAGGGDLIDNATLVAEWVTEMGKRPNFGKWIRQRIGEMDMTITRCDLPTMAVSALTKRGRKEALEVAIKWLRHAAAERALFASHGPKRWLLFEELLKWEYMLTEESTLVVRAVETVGDKLEEMLSVHCRQREVWKAVQHMMSSEDAWLYRKVRASEVEASVKLDLLDPSMLAMAGTSVEVQKAKRVSALRRGAGVMALVNVAKETAVVSAVDRRMYGWTHKHDTQSMELISTLLQGSVSAMRMWIRVLAQGQEVTAEVKGGITDPDKVDWAQMVRSGAGRRCNPEVNIQVSMQFVDMLGMMICAGDEEGMGGSDDEPVAPVCGDGGQDVCGRSDSATQSVLLPDMPGFSSDSSEEEDRILFEKRQSGKFGANSVSVKVGIQKGCAGRHIDSANIIESPRKRKATVVHNVEGHSGDEMCELDDSDVGSEFEAAMGESASSVESGVSNFDSDDERVCDVFRRRLGGSPVWTTNKSESRMDIGELDTSNMSVGEWLDYQSESGSGSGDTCIGSSDTSGDEEYSGKGKANTKQEAMVTDVEVTRWLEANQTPARSCGSGDGSGSDAEGGCGTGNGICRSSEGAPTLVMLDYGVLRLVMGFLPKKKWSTILPAVFAGARHASVDGRKDPEFARLQRLTARKEARRRAALLNNPWYCAAQLNC